MIETNFETSERPFLPAPLVSRYFPAAAIEDARRRLSSCIERADGPALLVGPAGTGKSLLCEVLAESFGKSNQVVYLSSGGLSTPLALLQGVMHALQLQYSGRDEGELRLALADHLGKKDTGRRLLLIVDDAESTPLRLLQELRNLTNLAREGKPLVLLVLAGSPELEELFAGPKLESFNQRLAVRCYLDVLDHAETCQYVRAQISAAGGIVDDLITPEGLDAVHRATGGVPRLVNQLCDHALLMATAASVERLDAAAIETAWADLQQLPTPWQPAQASGDGLRGPAGGLDGGLEGGDVVEFGSLEDDLDFGGEGSPSATPEFDEPLEAVASEATIPTVPFAAPPRPASMDLDGKFARLESHLAAADEAFGASEPVDSVGHLIVAPTTDPFGETFEEEEIVLDHFASLQASSTHIRRRVHCYESQGLASALRMCLSSDAVVAKGVQAPAANRDAAANGPTARLDAVEPEDDPLDMDTPTVVYNVPARSASGQPTPRMADVIRPEEFFAALDADDPRQDGLIIIDEVDSGSATSHRPKLRVAEFGQLFSKLRRE